MHILLHSRPWSHGGPARAPRRGAATVAAVAGVMMLFTLAMSMMVLATRAKSERLAVVHRNEARGIADSGVSHAVARLIAGDDTDIGAPGAPLAFSDGAYRVELTPEVDGSYVLTSIGYAHGEQVAIHAVAAPAAGGLFDNAVFAGNSSGDPTYVLEFGGTGAQADDIQGNVFSGGDVLVQDDAVVNGDIEAAGAVLGAIGSTGMKQPIPDLEAMDYANTADFDVQALFASATLESHDAGGEADQVSEDNPAHIFRRNPSDRTSETSSTTKDDYFLEDPYETVGIDAAQDGSDPYGITLSGLGAEPGPDGNRAVYYIDGNLWLHNKQSFSFAIEHNEANGIQVAFVVLGNIYFSDNLFYDDPDMDGVLFIALDDPDEPDSGNIYFGDSEFGTLEEMHAYMYAENDFLDVNMDAAGSKEVHLHGIMSAGNQVQIERDFEDAHSKLSVQFDDRVSTGVLDMPGVPLMSGADDPAFSVVFWRETALP